MKRFVEWLIRHFLPGYHLAKKPSKHVRKPVNRPQLFAAALVVCAALVAGCATCRERSVADAERLRARGYETRVAAYALNLDGLIYGAGIWKAHAQAQVLMDGRWLWVGEFGGLREEPTFRPKGWVVVWPVEEYKNGQGAMGKGLWAKENAAGVIR